MMAGTDKTPKVLTAATDVPINHDTALQARHKTSAIVARDDTVHLRDDPEAKAAFLATFTAEDEKRIMRKVDMRFVFLAGVMYLIKQVCSYIVNSVLKAR
jgi:hypothetical protein